MRERTLLSLASAAVFFSAIFSYAHASEVRGTCIGNIETFRRELIQAGVSYYIWYEFSGSTAKIRFAGREFQAEAATSTGGKAWKGRWLRRMDNGIYFSYLPDEGGTVKFELAPDRWFSGNCK
jgi:hypothetical protein